MAKGYVSIHRELFDHWVWEEKPFSRGQAWIDLIMMANHKDAKIMFDGRFIEVNRGDVITSSVKLSERWGWSRTKVGLFLENLETDHMIAKKTDSKKTALTICKYCDWQDSQTAEEQQKDSRKTAEEQQKDTINNVNNSNNDNKSDIKDYMPDAKAPDEQKVQKVDKDADPSNPYHKAAVHFSEMVLNANPTCKVPKEGTKQMGEWAKVIRLMFEADKRDREHVRETLTYCFEKDDFWSHTCQSPANFRKNYDKIRGKMLSSQKSNVTSGSFGRSMEKVLAWIPPDERMDTK
jgi:hypothetical protein